MLKIFNTLTREKEVFKPIHEGKVGMYVCGVTVYDLCHIGHGRTFVCFDVIARYLRSLGYDLTYVRNITDVDDKIIKRALENKETCDQLVDRMVQEMYKDFDALNVLRPDFEPRATHHIPEIIEIVEKLIARGHAYVADNGDVMFDVESFKEYGKQIVANAKAMAEVFSQSDLVRVISGGTDNHLFNLDLTATGLTGKEAQNLLDSIHITTNKEAIPNEPRSPFITSGIRIGTPAITTRGFKEHEAREVAHMILRAFENHDNQEVLDMIAKEVITLTDKFPLSGIEHAE